MESKFKLRERVHWIEGMEYKTGIITGITHAIGKTFYSEQFNYFFDDAEFSTNVKETDLFYTKQELIDSIFNKDE